MPVNHTAKGAAFLGRPRSTTEGPSTSGPFQFGFLESATDGLLENSNGRKRGREK